MFGLTFLNSVFLAGLAAAALPILIHLFSRRRARAIEFPSLEYLREISRQKIRRMRLRQWILLMLRVLIVALFALAMMRPAIRGSGSVVTRGSSTFALVLDNSYSMDAADPGLTGALPGEVRSPAAAGAAAASPVDEQGTVFLTAKERAEEILDLMGEGDRGLIALCGRPATVPFQTPVADAGLLRQEIRRASMVGDRSDLPAALEQLVPVLASAHTLNKEIFILSDFQKRDVDEWIRALSGGTSAAAAGDSAGASRAIRIPPGIRVYLVPVREGIASNASIERVRFDASAGVAQAGKITITVVNQGEDPIVDRVARALDANSGESALADGLFSLPPHGRGDVSLDLPRLPAGGALEVRIGSDGLEWDNHGYLVTQEAGVPRVLLVSGDDTPFLKAALDPEGNGEFFHLRQVAPDALGDAGAWDADVVILSNVGRLDDAAAENLARFRARGGGVLLGMGDHVDPRYYNTQILSKISSIELLNVTQQEGEGAYRALRPSVLSHPIFAGFPVGPGDDLGSARFHKLLTCRLGPSARVVADFGRDMPALIEDSRVLLFTSSFDGVWSDFVTSASFPPLLHQMVRYLASRGSSDQGMGLVGSRLETLVPEGAATSPVMCVDPMGGQSPVEEIPEERMMRLRSQATAWPGVYRFVDAAGKGVGSFAVNLDAREGDLATADPDAEVRLFGKDCTRLEPGKKISRELIEGRYGRELWRPILVLVLLLLAAESLLGRGKLLG